MAFGAMLAMGGASALYDILRAPGERRRARRTARKYETAQAEARRANEERYRRLMRDYRGMYTRGMKGFEGAEERGREAIERGYEGRRAEAGQEAVSRGLAGTTVLPTLRAGAERERASALTELAGRTGERRATYEEALTQPRLGMMERRTDEYPDWREMMGLAQAQGAGGPFGGGAFGGFMQNLPMLYSMTRGAPAMTRGTTPMTGAAGQTRAVSPLPMRSKYAGPGGLWSQYPQ